MKFNYSGISEFNLNALKQVGWYKERKVDIQYWLDYYKEYNLPDNENYREFLQNFGGLEIERPPEYPGRLYSPEDTQFDPILLDYELVQEYQDEMQCPQYPLGMIWHEYGSLFMTDQLKFYAVSDCGVHYVGENLSELFDVIISATRRGKLIFDENGAVE